MSRPSTETNELEKDGERPRKRRARPQLSCQECRRLKMKCDRKDPCANCLRRNTSCIWEPKTSDPLTSTPVRRTKLETRMAQLEDLLSSRGMDISSLDDGDTTTGPLEAIPIPAVPITTAIHPDPPDTVILHHSPHTDQNLTPHQPTPLSTMECPVPPISEHISSLTGEEQSHGTLVISHSGRSKYLGRTAASEWLKNQEVIEAAETPPPQSRWPSPEPMTTVTGKGAERGWGHDALTAKVAFPFDAASRILTTPSLLAQLPPIGDGRALVEVYYRHFSWHFNVILRDDLNPIVDKVYRYQRDPTATSKEVRPDHLALLYIILAMGSYYNLELPPDDPSVEEYLILSRVCLSKGDFMANNTLSGVQTLFIMAHLQLSMDSGKNGDSAWPLWGLTTRTIQAMGLHRDGERWKLPTDVVEQRRRVFWECHATDLLTSNCFSRPSGAISSDYIDTAYPTRRPDAADGFHRARFELSHHFGAVLDHTMRVRTPPYANVETLQQRINDFERNVPYDLRCRPVLLALPSVYPDHEAAIQASPSTNKRDLHQTFQQFTLSMNISELIVFLHRPYFARALHDSPSDPSRSPYAASYLTTVERCNAIVVIATSVYNLYPQTAARHWWIWYHTFNSAACMVTLILKNPHNVLAGFALTLIDSTINIYSSVVRNRNSPRMARNLRWLAQMRQKVGLRMSESPQTGQTGADARSEDNDAEVLGWKTRLIERAGQGLQTASTIRPDSTTHHPPDDLWTQFIQTLNSSEPGSSTLNQLSERSPVLSGDAFFNQFWDPMLGPDEVGDITDISWWTTGPDENG